MANHCPHCGGPLTVSVRRRCIICDRPTHKGDLVCGTCQRRGFSADPLFEHRGKDNQ